MDDLRKCQTQGATPAEPGDLPGALENQKTPPETKYYVYISETKISMLFEQNLNNEPISKRNIYGKIDLIKNRLLASGSVGSIESGAKYILCTILMSWSTFENYWSDLVIFGYSEGNTVLSLIGSSDSLIGQGKSRKSIKVRPPTSHSLSYYQMEYFNKILKINEDINLDDQQGRLYFKKMLASTEYAIRRIKNCPQKVEFLARILYREKINEKLLVVATPIFVALSDK